MSDIPSYDKLLHELGDENRENKKMIELLKNEIINNDYEISDLKNRNKELVEQLEDIKDDLDDMIENILTK